MDDADPPLLDRKLADGRPAFVKSPGPYAGLFGKSRQTGKNWNDAGLIVWVTDPATGEEIVDVAASDRRRHDQQNPLKRATPALAAPGPSATGKPADGPTLFTDQPDPAQSPPGASASPAGAGVPQPDRQLAMVSAQKVEGQDLDNALKRLRLAKAMSELVSAEERREAETRRMRRLRDRLLALPVALAEDLNPANPAHAQAVLRRELRLALEALADDLAADARRAYGAETGDDDEDNDTADTASGSDQSSLELTHA